MDYVIQDINNVIKLCPILIIYSGSLLISTNVYLKLPWSVKAELRIVFKNKNFHLNCFKLHFHLNFFKKY